MSNYYVLPSELLKNPDITATEKILLTVIFSLSGLKGYCFATNSKLGKIAGVHSTSISRAIAKLQEKGFLTSEITYKKNSKEVLERKIRLTNKSKQAHVKRSEPHSKTLRPPQQNAKTPPKQNAKDNNLIYINNLINNITEILPKHLNTLSLINSLREWIEYKQSEFSDKYKTTKSFEKLFKKYETVDELTSAIDSSIEKKYKGIYPDTTFKKQIYKKQTNFERNLEILKGGAK